MISIGWTPEPPTEPPLPPEVDGGRTSVMFKDVLAGADVLQMSPGDPVKVMRALVKRAQESQKAHEDKNDGLTDRLKRVEFFEWFRKHMHNQYQEWLATK